MNLTDEIMGKALEKAPEQMMKAADMTLKASKVAMDGVRETTGAVKGICILLMDCTAFTRDAVMKAVRDVAFKKTGDIKYSKNNIDISKLRESGHVYRVEGDVEADVMGYFDEQCKKHGVKYSAMKDTRGEGSSDYKPTYMVFFEGRDTETIMSALQETCKDYYEKQKQDKEAAKKPEKGNWKSKDKDKETKPENRESVKAKLAFFRDRVAARDQEWDGIEKHRQRTDIQR